MPDEKPRSTPATSDRAGVRFFSLGVRIVDQSNANRQRANDRDENRRRSQLQLEKQKGRQGKGKGLGDRTKKYSSVNTKLVNPGFVARKTSVFQGFQAVFNRGRVVQTKQPSLPGVGRLTPTRHGFVQ